ncbi:MAG: hypothetical protein ACOH2S_14850 [Janthinobacterium svalbardensis]
MAAKKIKKIFIGGRAKPLPRQGLCDLSGRKLRSAILNLGGLDPASSFEKGLVHGIAAHQPLDWPCWKNTEGQVFVLDKSDGIARR